MTAIRIVFCEGQEWPWVRFLPGRKAGRVVLLQFCEFCGGFPAELCNSLFASGYGFCYLSLKLFAFGLLKLALCGFFNVAAVSSLFLL